MKNLTSKLSLLTAFLCLVFTAQGQVTNPYNSSFEIDLTGTADPQLVLKREVTIGGGTISNPLPIVTNDYQWNISAGNNGLNLTNADNGTAIHALRLGIGAAIFNGDLLTVGNSLSADASGLTVMGNNFSVGNKFTINSNELVLTDKDLTIRRTDAGNTINELRITPDGIITARDVKVTTDPIPDYVFEPDYNLMSIEALKAYIAEHGHLPNIKSAEEYEAIGHVSLGELNIKLLEKVEELSLYTIELKEETTTLREELKAMRAELEALKAAK